MKKIEVIFRPEKLEPLKEKLLEAGIQGVTIFQVSGCGNQHGWIAYHRGNEVMMNTLPKVYLMTVVKDDEVEHILHLIKEIVYTGNVGDGKIFISTVDECIRIRTDETGDAAL
ncbi:P-II family nitrogen regulator [uncultured Ruminococcus sp.]|uniref:P-II family nitrogen regulator n=1 Tax=uncultured Ruminococcus sp. TaxID=165186 RepID=UPI0026323F8E|nr:P-II family nitrogen regulator [uncultured Ruminococcus sp.]